MNFQLTDDQIQFQKMVRDFAEKELGPTVAQRDNEGDCEATYKIMQEKMGPMGLLGIAYPKEYGGMGKSFIEFSIALSEICRVDTSIGAAYSVNMSIGHMPLFKFGSEEQKKKYLPSLFSGEKISSFALTEENAGSDSAMQETTAVLDGDEYVLNGKKVYITNAGYADIYTIFAMTDKDKKNKGISAFVVEKGTPGFEFGDEYNTMGIRACMQKELIFKNCRIPKENLIGKEGEGFKIAMTSLDVGRLGVASQGLGVAKGAYEKALNHAKERSQFGKPIAANQGISFMLSDMATEIECSELLILKSAWLLSEGKPYSKEVAMAKRYATDRAMDIATNAVQIFGGSGYLVETDIERYMRDAKILQIYEGTNQIMKLVISGHILK